MTDDQITEQLPDTFEAKLQRAFLMCECLNQKLVTPINEEQCLKLNETIIKMNKFLAKNNHIPAEQLQEDKVRLKKFIHLMDYVSQLCLENNHY